MNSPQQAACLAKGYINSELEVDSYDHGSWIIGIYLKHLGMKSRFTYSCLKTG